MTIDTIKIGMKVRVQAQGRDFNRVGLVVAQEPFDPRPLPPGHVWVSLYESHGWRGGSSGSEGINAYPVNALRVIEF